MALTQRNIQVGNSLAGVALADYSVEILRSPEEIRKLSRDVFSLVEDPAGTRNPCFFLASIDESAWSPIVVTVSRGESIVGIVYAKERKLAGIPIGLIYADATLDAMLVASLVERESVLSLALQSFIDLSSTRGLRVVVPAAGFERDAIGEFLRDRTLDVHYARVKNHNSISLPDNYEVFLESLGSRTRRNFRYYRRRFESEGHTYVEQLPLLEFTRIASELESKCVPMAGRKGIDRDLRMLSMIRDPILVGLRSKSGEWLSVLGGWHESGRTVVFLQLNNDREYPQSALYTVLRGYFIQGLISRKVPNLLFWGGSVGSLRSYCQHVPAVCAHLNRPTVAWRTIRNLIGWSVAYLPVHLRMSARWVASVENYEPSEPV
jgi:hypothetical protein